MKQHSSVLLLICRSTALPGFLLLLAMAALETGLFFYDLRQYAEMALEMFLTQQLLPFCFILAIFLLTGFLAQFGAKSGCTLMRLSVTEQHVFLIHGLCCLVWYGIFWGLQTLLLTCLCQFFFARYPNAAGSQALLQAVHYSRFFHGLLPMEDVLLWISNVLLLAALAAAAAHFPYGLRRSKPLQELVPVLVLFSLSRTPGLELSFLKVLTPVGSLLAIVYAFYCVFREEDVLYEAA